VQVATLLLTRSAKAGLNLAEIGNVASRPLVGMDEEASELEKACLAARYATDTLPMHSLKVQSQRIASELESAELDIACLAVR
jgi:hypothetical protein